MADAFWDPKVGVKLEDLVKSQAELSAFKAEADKRAGLVPESADKYEAVLPKDFNLPDGWVINPEKPLWKAGREFAKANGLTQEQFSGLAKLYVEGQIAEKAQSDGELAAMVAARDKALGANGPSRVEALNNWFGANFDEKVAKQLSQTLFTPDIVSAFERIQLAMTTQGIVNLSDGGRAQGRNDGRPENWETMSAVDRRTWDLIQQQNAKQR